MYSLNQLRPSQNTPQGAIQATRSRHLHSSNDALRSSTRSQDRQGSSSSHRASTASSATTESYASKVAKHARTTIEHSLYSGREFEDLAQLLSQAQDGVREGSSVHAGDDGDEGTHIALLYELDGNGPLEATPLTATNCEARVRDTPDHARLIFLLGFPTARLLNVLGTRYDVDPEFYRRHLSRDSQPRDVRTASNSPTFVLPSFQRSIFQLSFTTLGRNDDRSIEDISKVRERASEELDEYLYRLQLGNGWRAGDSIVRAFTPHARKVFSIEQQATIYIRQDPERKDQWIAFVWLDCGTDLARSPPGPWTASSTPWAEFQPTVFYEAGIALTRHAVTDGKTPHRSPCDPAFPAMPQSLALLSDFYGRSLRVSEMSINPLYALHELFAYFNVSEMQLFNAIAQDLEHATRASQNLDSNDSVQAQATFSHYRLFLRGHVRRIMSIIAFLNTDETETRSSAAATETSDTARQRLKCDLQHLLECGTALERQCEREIGMIMSAATIAETRSAMRLTARSYRWAVLAAAYVPLSFTSTILGMNFVQFRNVAAGLWTWLVVTVPVLAASLVLITWNTKEAKKAAKRLFGN